MTQKPKHTVQQTWAQQAFLSVVKQVVPLIRSTAAPPRAFAHPTLVTYGFDIAGRRTRRLWTAHLANPADQVAQNTIFITPRAWTTAPEVLDLLIRAAIDLMAQTYGRPIDVRSERWNYTYQLGKHKPQVDRAKQQLLMFLPKFPPATYDPATKVQQGRMRLWACPDCGQKVRAATDDLRIICDMCIGQPRYVHVPKKGV